MPDTDNEHSTESESDTLVIDSAKSGLTPEGRKDWAPLRALAQTRARVRLVKTWEDLATGKRIWAARFSRFCYTDYAKERTDVSLIETPHCVSIDVSHKPKTSKLRYVVSFRGGRVALYNRSKIPNGLYILRHSLPFYINLMAPLTHGYPEAEKRFNRKVIKVLRSKARANGAKLCSGDYDKVGTLLTDTLFPALKTVREQHKALRNDGWMAGRDDRWLLRHLRCEPEALVKRMTGYDSRVVKRLFWEAMKPPPMSPQQPPWTTVSSLWRDKWCWLALLRTWLPVDFTQQILRADKIANWSFDQNVAEVRKLLKQWEPKQVARMLTETATGSMIRDTLHMLAQRCNHTNRVAAAIPRTRNVVELHDWLIHERNSQWERNREQQRLANEATERRRLEAMSPEERTAFEQREADRLARIAKDREEELKPLPVDYGKDVDGKQVTVGDAVYTVVTPKSNDDLAAWGSGMHNCIGGYASLIRSGHCQIFGVRISGSDRPVHWGIEVANGEIRQFKGIHNQGAPSDLQVAVTALLTEAKLIGHGYDCVAIAAEVARGMGVPQHLVAA